MPRYGPDPHRLVTVFVYARLWRRAGVMTDVGLLVLSAAAAFAIARNLERESASEAPVAS